MSIGTLDQWLEKQLSMSADEKREKRLEPKANGSPGSKKTWKLDAFGKALADRPERRTVKRIAIPVQNKAFWWLYGQKNESGRG